MEDQVQDNVFLGAKIDDRRPSDIKDYSHLETGRSQTPIFLKKKEAVKVEKLYDKRNQKSTSSCGAHAGELALSIDTGFTHEPAFIYRLRRNYPDEGMYHYDIGDILKFFGACEYLGIDKTELAYNRYQASDSQFTEAKKFAGSPYIVLTDNKFSMDDVAYIVNNLKRPLTLFVYWDGKEWNSKHPETAGDVSDVFMAKYHHFVTVLPNSAYEEKGKKYCIVQDSAWFGGENIRHISEEWLDRRIYTGLYRTKFEFEETKPQYTSYVFKRTLQYGDQGQDVKELQNILKSLGYFPSNIETTVYFRGITRQAVKDFQAANRNWILKPLGLDKPTGIFGPSTRKRLTALLK
jgi:hypothetical protein